MMRDRILMEIKMSIHNPHPILLIVIIQITMIPEATTIMMIKTQCKRHARMIMMINIHITLNLKTTHLETIKIIQIKDQTKIIHQTQIDKTKMMMRILLNKLIAVVMITQMRMIIIQTNILIIPIGQIKTHDNLEDLEVMMERAIKIMMMIRTLLNNIGVGQIKPHKNTEDLAIMTIMNKIMMTTRTPYNKFIEVGQMKTRDNTKDLTVMTEIMIRIMTMTRTLLNKQEETITMMKTNILEILMIIHTLILILLLIQTKTKTILKIRIRIRMKGKIKMKILLKVSDQLMMIKMLLKRMRRRTNLLRLLNLKYLLLKI